MTSATASSATAKKKKRTVTKKTLIKKPTVVAKDKTNNRAIKRKNIIIQDKKLSKANLNYQYAVGRRKTAIARVRRIKGGVGMVKINNLPLDKYFPEFELRFIVESPIKLIAADDRYDYSIKVHGGGKKSQAEATRLGITRVLIDANEQWRQPLKQAGWVRRDARVKERKKPGLKRARRAPQWQKR